MDISNDTQTFFDLKLMLAFYYGVNESEIFFTVLYNTTIKL